MEEGYLPQAKHLVQKFKQLYTHGLLEPWETVFRTDFRNTWIQAVVQSIDGEGLAGLKTRVNDENLAHEIKTPVNNNAKSIIKLLKTKFNKFSFRIFKERSDEVVEISGLARILLNQLVNFQWVPLVYLQFLFAVAFSFREAELPHGDQSELPCGSHIHLFRV